MRDTSLSLSRRATLSWMTAAAAAAGGPFLFAGHARAQSRPTPWPRLALPKNTASGYGQDPDLAAKTVPWPLLLSESERARLRIAADIIMPPGGDQKAPSALGIDAFFNEWVSAPYTQQVADRALIVPGLVWLDAEARIRFDRDFAGASEEQRCAIFDTVAYPGKIVEGYRQAGEFFACLRKLTILGYYTTPQGMAELGFAGNTPIQGMYPGPSAAALEHLARKLEALGLTTPK